MNTTDLILIVDGLVALALRLLDVAQQQSGEGDEVQRLEALKQRLAETAAQVAAWRP
jgi:hypothetical protein